MTIFQITHKYDPYIAYFEKKYAITNNTSFNKILSLLLEDGFYGPHLLLPIINKEQDSFYTMWNYERLQFKWAQENNFESKDLKKILFKQLEKIKPSVVYNLSPQLIDYSFFQKLLFSTKLICWNADPFSINDNVLQKYDALLTSSFLKVEEYKNAHLHYPSNHPGMDEVSLKNKKIDVLFYGQYLSNGFSERVVYINQLIPFFNKNNINFKFALMYKKWKVPIINKRILWKLPFLQKELPSKKLIKNFDAPIFGKDIYKNISEAKIVFNISTDSDAFGSYKFNMRIFETLGVGSLMLSDEGIYPENIIPNKDFILYKNIDDLKYKIKYFLQNNEEREAIAISGKSKINKFYSKEEQWKNFVSIVDKIKK